MRMASEIRKVAYFTVPYEPKISSKFGLQLKTNPYLLWVVEVVCWTCTLLLGYNDTKCCPDMVVTVYLAPSQAFNIEELTWPCLYDLRQLLLLHTFPEITELQRI